MESIGRSAAFNKNRSCIEILKIGSHQRGIIPFNKNRSCIEIWLRFLLLQLLRHLIRTEVVLKYGDCFLFINGVVFNKNRSCIEINFSSYTNLSRVHLIRTEVVLKLTKTLYQEVMKVHLIRTEVVLK